MILTIFDVKPTTITLIDIVYNNGKCYVNIAILWLKTRMQIPVKSNRPFKTYADFAQRGRIVKPQNKIMFEL